MHQIVPDLAVLFATNEVWWDYYWPRDDGPRLHPCEKWTNCHGPDYRYGINYVGSRDAPGLGTRGLHHGHSSGFCLLNLAYLMGAERIVLLGYDMKYAPDYEPANRQAGSSPRHYFGEYPSAMQHWPKVSVKHGIHVQLLDQYRSVAVQNVVEIVNCTPGSALDCFPKQAIDDL